MVHFGFRRVARGLNIVSCLLAVLPSCLLAVLIHNFGSIYQSQVTFEDYIESLKDSGAINGN